MCSVLITRKSLLSINNDNKQVIGLYPTAICDSLSFVFPTIISGDFIFQDFREESHYTKGNIIEYIT